MSSRQRLLRQKATVSTTIGRENCSMKLLETTELYNEGLEKAVAMDVNLTFPGLRSVED